MKVDKSGWKWIRYQQCYQHLWCIFLPFLLLTFLTLAHSWSALVSSGSEWRIPFAGQKRLHGKHLHFFWNVQPYFFHFYFVDYNSFYFYIFFTFGPSPSQHLITLVTSGWEWVIVGCQDSFCWTDNASSSPLASTYQPSLPLPSSAFGSDLKKITNHCRHWQ